MPGEQWGIEAHVRMRNAMQKPAAKRGRKAAAAEDDQEEGAVIEAARDDAPAPKPQARAKKTALARPGHVKLGDELGARLESW